MPYGIEKIEYHLPQRVITADELAAQFAFDRDFISRKLGVQKIFVARDDEQTSDLAVKAIEKLSRACPGLRDRVQALVVCTQTPDFQLPHVSALVQDRAGLRSTTAAFDIGLGCSGFVYGLSVLQGFLEQNDFDSGLLVTAETYSKIIDEQDRNTKCLFSDAAAATLVSRRGRLIPMKFTFGTSGDKFDHLIFRGRAEPVEPAHGLFMDGRGIFSFVAEMVPADVAACLKRNGLAMADVDLFVFHQASSFLLETIAKQLGIPRDPRVVNCLNAFANTVSSSIPMALKQTLPQCTKPALNVLVSGFGVGLSWATTILRAEGPYDDI